MPRLQYKKHYLEYISRSLQFYVQVPSSQCNVEFVDGEKWGSIKGEWGPELQEYSKWGSRSLLEHFLNCQNDASAIAEFTRKFGPLEDEPAPSKKFSFTLAQWRKRQDHARGAWRFCHGGRTTPKTENEFPVQSGEAFLSFPARGQLRYRAANLFRFIELQLMAVPVERIGLCERYIKSQRPVDWRKAERAEEAPNCRTPYFIAHDLRQRYCSQRCAAWAQRVAKLRWWNAHGSESKGNKQRGMQDSRGKQQQSKRGVK